MPKTLKAEVAVHNEWREIVDRAPLTISGGMATEPPAGKQEAPELQAPSPTAPEPKAPLPPEAVKQLLANYPAGVPLTLPERPWGSSTFRSWAWGLALVALLLAFIAVIVFTVAELVPAVAITVAVAVPLLRSFTIARLDGGLSPKDGARAPASAAAADRPQDTEATRRSD